MATPAPMPNGKFKTNSKTKPVPMPNGKLKTTGKTKPVPMPNGTIKPKPKVTPKPKPTLPSLAEYKTSAAYKTHSMTYKQYLQSFKDKYGMK